MASKSLLRLVSFLALGLSAYTLDCPAQQIKSPKGIQTVFHSTAHLAELYDKYGADLAEARKLVRSWLDGVPPQRGKSGKPSPQGGIGDLEAEMVYLRVRETQPELVGELGFGSGLTTNYLICALMHNGKGSLYTFDMHDNSKRGEPTVEFWRTHWPEFHWQLYLGDAMKMVPQVLGPTGQFDYIHSDCEHSTAFAHWLVEKHLTTYKHRAVLSFHDVFVAKSNLVKDSKDGVSAEGRVVLNHMVKHPEHFRCTHSIAQSHFHDEWAHMSQKRDQVLPDTTRIALKPSTFNEPSLFIEYLP